MNEVLINAFVARVKAGLMTLEQVPIPYQEEVRIRLEQDGQVRGDNSDAEEGGDE
jgi:hypothetical protein